MESKIIAGVGIVAVSCTHLDVYKRQLDIFLDMMHHTSQRCEFAEREPEFYRNQMIAYGCLLYTSIVW